MNKVTNARFGLCQDCHWAEKAITQYKGGIEVSVCYHCGLVKFNNTKFNSRDYIKSLIEDGVDCEEEAEEVLIEKLSEVYVETDYLSVEILSKMLVHELFDDLKFEVEAEAEDAREYSQEIRESYAGAY